MTTLSQLKSRAEAARSRFESQQKELYRSDGSKVYGEVEHLERLGRLRAERNTELTQVETQLAAEVEAANVLIAFYENGGPTAWLTAEEQESASARLALVRADVANLGREDLVERLKVVSRMADRAGKASYWLSARAKASATKDVEMLGVLDDLKESIVPSYHKEKQEAARQTLRDSYEVQSVTYYARREISGALGGYQPNYIRPGNVPTGV